MSRIWGGVTVITVCSLVYTMTMYNSEVDPYRAGEGYYECLECGARGDSAGVCDGCGSDALVNIAVPRE